MRVLSPTLSVFVALLLNFAALDSITRAEPPTTQQLNTQANWMNAWAGWMNSWANVQNGAAKANTYTQVVEAEAKLITARAAMVTAMANANKANAEALQGLEQARSLALDNNLKKAETFYGKRTLYENHRNLKKARPRPTEEALLRYSRASVPDRLTPSQLDPIRGEIHWPSLLQREQFVDYRTQLEGLFVKRLDYQENIHQQVNDLADGMHGELCALVREAAPAEYVEARKFIRSLVYESRFPARIETVAAN